MLSSAPIDSNSARYVLAGYVAVGALLPLLALRNHVWNVAVTAGVCAFALIASYQVIRNPFQPQLKFPTPQQAQALARFAKAEHVKYGYTGYWDAADLTWMSRFDVKVYPVSQCTSQKLAICPFNIGISSWYKPRPNTNSMLVIDHGIQLQTVTAPSPGDGTPIASPRSATLRSTSIRSTSRRASSAAERGPGRGEVKSAKGPPCKAAPVCRLCWRSFADAAGASAYQEIGGGGVAVMLIVLPDPDIRLVRSGPKRPQPPKDGTVTFVLTAKPPVASAFTGSLMLSGIWIGSIVVQPIGNVISPAPTEPTTMFAAPVALWLNTPEFESETKPVIVPTGVSAPLMVTGMPSRSPSGGSAGSCRLAVSLPVVTSPSAVSVARSELRSRSRLGLGDRSLQMPRRQRDDQVAGLRRECALEGSVASPRAGRTCSAPSCRRAVRRSR